jgi:hypothetical protein
MLNRAFWWCLFSGVAEYNDYTLWLFNITMAAITIKIIATSSF